MTYYIKIHLLEDQEYFEENDYDGQDIFALSYNEALSLLGEEEEIFYNEIEEGFYEEENERYSEIFEHLGGKGLYGGEIYYYIVKINFDGINKNQIDKFIEYFLSFLKEKSHFLWKFEDSRFVDIRKDFFEEVYKIEINLREIISFIFFNTYLSYKDLLKDIQVSPVIKLNKNQKIEEILQEYENEFFYISFSEYKNLLNLTTLKDKEKTDLLEISSSFDEWKNKIFNRGVQKEFYIDFINSIKEDLENLEKFRNAIMHNRGFSKTIKENYEKSKDEINKKIKKFREKHMYLGSNNLDLIIGKKYTYIGDTTDNFIQGKKYELIEIYGGDTIFMGEKEKNSIPFWDKEFSLFWEWE